MHATSTNEECLWEAWGLSLCLSVVPFWCVAYTHLANWFLHVCVIICMLLMCHVYESGNMQRWTKTSWGGKEDVIHGKKIWVIKCSLGKGHLGWYFYWSRESSVCDFRWLCGCLSERETERGEKVKATKVLGILFETLSPLSECPWGSRLISLKALKTPHRTHAWLWNKYQDRSWIVFKLNAICRSCEPSFHLPPTSLDLSFFHLMPASLFVSITKRFSGIVLLQRQIGKRSLPHKSLEPGNIWYITAIKS